jgi:hypothetical protein
VPKNSISRKVARAAAIGGSRSYKQRSPIGWYTILLLVCVVGVGLIVFSRHERQVRATAASTTTTTTQANTTPPTLNDHWQEAFSLDICGQVVNLPRSANMSSGIVSDGNGVVDIWPARAGKDAAQFEGAKATLGKFLASEDVGLTTTSLELPKSVGKLAGTYRNGRKCGTKPAQLAMTIWPTPTSASSFPGVLSGNTVYGNGELFMLGFLPKGASVARPPAAPLIAAFLKSQTTTTTVKSSTTTTSTKPGSTATSTTTSPSSTTTTTG